MSNQKNPSMHMLPVSLIAGLSVSAKSLETAVEIVQASTKFRFSGADSKELIDGFKTQFERFSKVGGYADAKQKLKQSIETIQETTRISANGAGDHAQQSQPQQQMQQPQRGGQHK